MAQPPEYNETFLREVDENLRRDQLRDFGRKYGGWLIGAVGLFLIASGGFIYWQQHSASRSQQQVEQLAEIYRNIGEGSVGAAAQQLDQLAGSRSKAVRASALFTRAALALQQNDTKLAAAKYAQVAADGSMPQAYRDAGTIREVALDFDSLQPQQVIDRLAPLAKPGAPWFGSAGEMTAMALIKQGQSARAAQLLATIAKDTSVPDSIRARCVQLAGNLGVDASGALTPAQ